MEPESPNGKSRWERIEESLAANWEEHDRIYKSMADLRVSSLEVDKHVKSLIAAIRDLIDRIPPEHLR